MSRQCCSNKKLKVLVYLVKFLRARCMHPPYCCCIVLCASPTINLLLWDLKVLYTLLKIHHTLDGFMKGTSLKEWTEGKTCVNMNITHIKSEYHQTGNAHKTGAEKGDFLIYIISFRLWHRSNANQRRRKVKDRPFSLCLGTQPPQEALSPFKRKRLQNGDRKKNTIKSASNPPHL